MNGPFDRKRPPSTSTTGATLPGRPPPVVSSHGPRSAPTSTVSRAEEDDARSSSKYRAALEALFAPKAAVAAPPPIVAERPAKKVVTVPSRDDPRGPEREKRLSKLLAAEGRAAVTKAAEDFAAAGFEFPPEQEVMLKLLDHGREDRVLTALECVARLLEGEPAQRRAVLDARLRRLGESADDPEVRALATSLQRQLLPRAGR